MPPILKRLMRHASITTSEAYDVDLDANAVADELWAKFSPEGNSLNQGNISGNIAPKAADSADPEIDVNPYSVTSRGGTRTRTSD